MTVPRHNTALGAGRHREPSSPRLRRGMLGSILTIGVGAALVGGALVSTDTWASYQDQARLSSEYGAFFSTGIMDSANIFKPGSEGTSTVSFTGAQSFVPGNTAIIPLSVANNSPTVSAVMTVAIDPGTVSAAVADQIRVSIDQTVDGTTTTVLGTPADPSASTATLADLASAHSAALAPRHTDPLTSGATWTGPEDSRASLRVYLYLKDAPAMADLRSVALDLAVTVTGASSD